MQNIFRQNKQLLPKKLTNSKTIEQAAMGMQQTIRCIVLYVNTVFNTSEIQQVMKDLTLSSRCI